MRQHRIGSLAGLLLLCGSAQAGFITANLEIRWHADEAGANPAASWEPGTGTVPANTVRNFNVLGGTQYIASDPSALPGINASYRFDGVNDRLTGASLDRLPSDPGGGATDFSRNSASIEIWFRPSDLLGQEILFETGGSRPFGSGFFLDGTRLLFRGASDGNQNPSTENFEASVDLAGIGVDEFIQAVGVIDFALQTATLFVNGGALSAQDLFAGTGFDRWAGGNATGVADNNGATGGDFNGELAGFGNYAGDIAIIGFYSQALGLADVQQNFGAVVPTPGTGLMMLVGLAWWRQRQKRRHEAGVFA